MVKPGRTVDAVTVQVCANVDHACAPRTEAAQMEARMRSLARFCRVYTICYSVYMGLRHKHLKIDQRKLDRAKQLLKLPTEQATIDRALDAILADDLIAKAHKKVRGIGGIEDPFEGDE
jgi:hypothetical protein